MSLQESIVHNIITHLHQGQSIHHAFQDVLSKLDRNILQSLHASSDQHIAVEDLLRILLCQIPHPSHLNLSYSLAIIRLYHKIKQHKDNDQSIVTLADITNYICQLIYDKDSQIIQPLLKSNGSHPPIIYNLSKIEIPIPKITKQSLINKRNKKVNKPLDHFIYSSSLNQIIALGRLDSSIYFYNLHLQEVMILHPKITNKKDITIISFAYSEKYSRIGYLVKGIGLVLSQAADNFISEKIIKCSAQKVIYLEKADEWLTIGDNTIHNWSIEQQNIISSIVIANCLQIHQLCQIPHLSSICIGYMTAHHKCMAIYHQNRMMSKIELGSSGCHTLHYNHKTQSLLLLGYKPQVNVYHFDQLTWDFEHRSNLVGHQTMVTCITTFYSHTNNALVITGDDKGYVRIWDLTTMRSLQVIKIAKSLKTLLTIHQKWLLFGDQRINILKIDFDEPSNHLPKINHQDKTVYLYLFTEDRYTYVITNKQLHIMNLQNGRVQEIHMLVQYPHQQITTASHLKGSSCFLIGTSKGDLMRVKQDGKVKWKINAHDGQVISIYFEQNKIDPTKTYVISSGVDNKVCLWSYMAGNVVRSFNTNHTQCLKLVCISKEWQILATYNQSHQYIKIWDLESLKFSQKININNVSINCIKISHQLPLLLIGCDDRTIQFYRITKLNQILKIQKITQINVSLMSDTIIDDKGYRCRKLSQLNYQPYYYQQTNLNSNSLQSIQIYYQYSKNCYYLIQIYSNGIISVNKLLKQFLLLLKPQNEIQCKTIHTQIKIKCRQSLTLSNKKLSKKNRLFTNYHCQLWSASIHQTTITSFQFINADQTYISTLSKHGIIKINQLQTGLLISQSNLNTLTSKQWLTISHANKQLKHQIHQGLIIINNVIKKYGFNLTKKQVNAIDVKDYMLSISQSPSSQFSQYPFRNSHCQNRQQLNNLKGKQHRNMSLKVMQAEKRIKMIKQRSNKKIQPYIQSRQNKYDNDQFKKIRKDLLDFFSPKYFLKLTQQNQSLPTNSILNQKIDGIINQMTGMKRVKDKQIHDLDKIRSNFQTTNCAKIQNFQQKLKLNQNKSNSLDQLNKTKLFIKSMDIKLNYCKNNSKYLKKTNLR